MPCNKPIRRWEFDGKVYFTEPDLKFYKGRSADNNSVLIPCGRCIGCRLDYANDWAMRCMLESKSFEHNYFLTLTYDNDHVPNSGNYNVDDITGEATPIYTLYPADLRNFIKRLRETYHRKFGHDGIRYFACGEYGAQGSRPHYHMIAFNLPILDLNKKFNNDFGDPIYTSDFISSIWQNGIISIGEVSYNSCSYVARYITKKQYGQNSKIYDELGIVPEFTCMSRRPGIGSDYYEKHKDEMYENDQIIMSNKKGTVIRNPCRFFDEKLKIDNLQKYLEIKDKRRYIADEMLHTRMQQTTLNIAEQGLVNEKALEEKNRALIRVLG